MIELKINNTKQAEYEVCQQEWESVGGKKSVYSTFETVKENGLSIKGWIVAYPDFQSETPLIEGEWIIKIADWDEYKTPFPIKNPTWRHIADILERNDGHHIFLEAIMVDDQNKTLELWMGS